MTTIKSLNAHATQILSTNTPVITNINPAGREVLVFDGDNISQFVLLELEGTSLPVPKVDTTEPAQELLEIEGGVQIPVQVSSGTVISNLPEVEEGIMFMTSYPTAKAAAELGRYDFVNAGPTVFADYDEVAGRGINILGCLGVNRFA